MRTRDLFSSSMTCKIVFGPLRPVLGPASNTPVKSGQPCSATQASRPSQTDKARPGQPRGQLRQAQPSQTPASVQRGQIKQGRKRVYVKTNVFCTIVIFSWIFLRIRCPLRIRWPQILRIRCPLRLLGPPEYRPCMNRNTM